MTYATQADIIDLYGLDALAAADRDGDGVADLEAVAKALNSASAEADSYLSVRYETPVSGTHPHLVQICVDIALYRLSNARGFLTDELRVRYDDALAALKAYAAGKAALKIPVDSDADPELVDQGARPMLTTGPARIFGRDTLRDL